MPAPPHPNPAHHHGLRTTEFWLTLAFQAGNLGAALAGVLPAKWAAVASAASAALYAGARAYTKANS